MNDMGTPACGWCSIHTRYTGTTGASSRIFILGKIRLCTYRQFLKYGGATLFGTTVQSTQLKRPNKRWLVFCVCIPQTLHVRTAMYNSRAQDSIGGSGAYTHTNVHCTYVHMYACLHWYEVNTHVCTYVRMYVNILLYIHIYGTVQKKLNGNLNYLFPVNS